MEYLYVIYYWNGEHYDDSWSGILESEGVFATQKLADDRVKVLQIDHDFKMQDMEEIPPNSEESWQVRAIKLINI